MIERIPSDFPHLNCPAKDLEEVFYHLAKNALQAMSSADSHKLVLRASLGFTPKEDRAAFLYIGDTGPGISPEDLPRVFEAFYTTKPPQEGSGLGLAITRRLIEKYSGRISVSSFPGAGTTFTLCLPVA